MPVMPAIMRGCLPRRRYDVLPSGQLLRLSRRRRLCRPKGQPAPPRRRLFVPPFQFVSSGEYHVAS